MTIIEALAFSLTCSILDPATQPQDQPAKASAALPGDEAIDRFQLSTSEWVALHFFAYHATRAQADLDDWMSVPLLPEDAALLANPTIAAQFAPVAELYTPVMEMPLVRGGLFSFLLGLDEAPASIEDPENRAVLKGFMPTYRKYFWARHRAMAELFAYEMRAEIATRGPAMAAAVADELDSAWGDRDYTVYALPYVNWAGAMSGAGHVYLSAQEKELSNHPLEIFFHETAHNRPIGEKIRPAAEAALEANGLENNRFWHYLLFYATGRAAKRVLGDDYVTYIEATGLRTREDTKPWYDALEAVWDNHDTLEARAMAAAALVAAEQ